MKMKLNLLFCCLLAFTASFAQQVQLVTDLTGDASSSFDEPNESPLISLNNQVIFRLLDDQNNWQLWISDGSAAGTIVLKTLATDFYIRSFVKYNNEFIFLVSDNDLTEFWKTDGTPGGTSLMHTENHRANFPTILNDVLYFATDEGGSGDILHRLDLADNAVEEVYSFNSFRGLRDMEILNDNQLILLGEFDGNRALLVTDGTTAGTEFLLTINDGSEFSQSTNMTRVGNRVFFFYKFPSSEFYLYVTDGTIAGTNQLMEFEDIETNLSSDRSALAFGNKFLFRAQPIGAAGNQDRLFVSDGTMAGTFNLDPDQDEYLRPDYLTPYNNQVYFRGDFCCFTFGIFKTNGTTTGTDIVTSGSALGSGGSFGGDFMTVFNNRLFFAAYRSETGLDLWASNGTENGTEAIEVAPGASPSSPAHLIPTDNLLFFTANTEANGRELYIYTPTCVDASFVFNENICEGEAFELGGNLYTTAGSYQEMLTSYAGCDSTVSLELSVNPSPSVSLGADAVIGNDSTLMLSVDAGFESIVWSDGSLSEDFNFSGADNGVGTFEVYVTVGNDLNCFSTDTIQITVLNSVGIESLPFSDRFNWTLSPNPVKQGNILTLALEEGHQTNEEAQIKMTDLYGRTLVEKVFSTADSQCSLSIPRHLQSGVYLIQSTIEGKLIYSQKLILLE